MSDVMIFHGITGLIPRAAGLEEPLLTEATDCRVILYPGAGHTFADPEAEDYNPEQAPP
jgi:hypothetical protein